MSDDISGFDWWFRNRDYVLRERLAEVQTEAYAASARSNARLSSKLSRLQGSLEGRLNALSAAFDAYVELGDIREQLAAYGDSAAIRRESLAAIAALGDGQPAKPVDDRGSNAWLPTATNALIARVSGAPDEDAEAAARQQDPSAELFLVAGAGVLGRGPEVASRVPAVLPSDGSRFDAHQQVIWQAVVDGVFGSGLLALLLQDWQPLLPTDAAEWSDWARQRAGQEGQTLLNWIEGQATGPSRRPPSLVEHQEGGPATEIDPGSQLSGADSGLQGLVFEMINAGQGEERELLARARELRARIENPTANESSSRINTGPTGVGTLENPAEQGIPGVELIRQAFLDTSRDSAAHADLRAVVFPGLLAVVEQETPAILHHEPTTTVVRIHGHAVPITADGPDRSELAKAQSVPMVGDPANSNSRLYGFAGGAGAALVLALILAIAGVSAALVILLLIGAVVLGIFAGRVWLGRRREQQEVEERRKADLASVDQAVLQAKQSDVAQRSAAQESAAQLDRIRMALTVG
jgi:hypothetical protein